MKTKTVIGILASAVLFVNAGNALAVTDYNQSIIPTNGYALTSSNSWTGTFTNINNQFVSGDLDLILTNVSSTVSIPFNGTTYTFLIPGTAGVVAASSGNTLYSGLINSGILDIKLTGDVLNAFNSSISNKSIGIGLGINGNATLAGATLSGNYAPKTGTVAPEPVSMALVCAGLAGLPFARRFRNKLQKV